MSCSSNVKTCVTRVRAASFIPRANGQSTVWKRLEVDTRKTVDIWMTQTQGHGIERGEIVQRVRKWIKIHSSKRVRKYLEGTEANKRGSGEEWKWKRVRVETKKNLVSNIRTMEILRIGQAKRKWELERIICFISHRALRIHLNYVIIVVLKQIIPLTLNHCLEFGISRTLFNFLKIINIFCYCKISLGVISLIIWRYRKCNLKFIMSLFLTKKHFIIYIFYHIYINWVIDINN